MRTRKISTLFLLFSLSFLSPQAKELPPTLTWKELKLDKKIKEKIEKENEIYCQSQVHHNSLKKEQSLTFFIAGLHPKNCQVALSKLSQYERFSEFLDFVTQSSYNKKKERVHLSLEHILMPFNMTLNFSLPRIRKEGFYPFFFDKGFLKGLKGEINVSSFQKRCLFTTEAKWSGPKTKIPDSIFSLFSQVLGKKGMETLFRISRTR